MAFVIVCIIYKKNYILIPFLKVLPFDI